MIFMVFFLCFYKLSLIIETSTVFDHPCVTFVRSVGRVPEYRYPWIMGLNVTSVCLTVYLESKEFRVEIYCEQR